MEPQKSEYSFASGKADRSRVEGGWLREEKIPDLQKKALILPV
jgi:hypothetical protein